MIKNIIAIYPGRFQPFGQHHAAAFKWLQKEFGAANAYIVTSNVVQPPKSPFSFKDKQDIIRQYGFDDRLVQVKNPYKSEEILKQLNPNDTAVVFMVGAKDMAEDPRFKIGKKASGGDSYFQDYKKNKSNLKGFDKHGYLIVAPHVEINIPGYGEMSGTTLRKVLGAKKPRAQKAEQFKAIFGWYNKKTADMVFDKLEGIKESTLFSKQWWGESLDLTEAISMDELKSKFKKFIDNIKQEGRETKEAFSLLGKAAMGKIELTDAQKTQIGEQMKDVLKTIGLSALAIAPGGLIAGLLIKVMKAEKYITPSAFMKEAVLKPNAWKDFKLTTLSEDDMKVIWDMYTSTYAKQGMDFSADNFTELQSKYKAVYLEDVDGDSIADAFIVYKSTPYGNKISLLGTNDKKEAKKELISKLFNLLKTRSWYIEASMKMEEILSKRSDIDAVTDETVIKGVAGDKSLEMMEDGYYKRKLSKVDKSIVKRIYGKPTVTSIKEDKKDKSDPCWSGYRQYGMKKKGSKEVPNCVPESVSEGSMSTEQQKTHNTKIDKLKSFLDSNIGREFEYDFDVFSKTVFGVKMPTQEFVKCEICNEQKQQLTGSHMLCKHGITLKEYKSKFPNSKCIPNSVSKKMSENNAMKNPTTVQKIKKTKLERYGSETYNNPKYGDDNPSKRDDVRKLISKKVTESYNKDPKLKINRSEIGTRYGFGDKKSFKKKMIDNGYWVSENSKTEFNLYRDSVRAITETNYQYWFKEILNAHLRSRTMHLDHKYSIFEGFIHDIDPHIIGHYKNLEIINHSINESKNIKSSISLSKLVEDILNSKNTLDMGYQLLMCGGAGGHMQHPFDIEWVDTGKDLLTVFQQSVNYLKKGPASVKIDGVNASIRLITLDGKKVFVMDRGSNKPLDVKGITKAELIDRFGAGHGMIKVGGKVLDIFNDSIPACTPALKRLGLWDNPNILFNIEYVAGSTNVLAYDKNFLAVHGLLEIEQVTPTKRATKEKPTNKAAMQDMLNNLAPVANKNGYDVLGSIPTTLDGNPDLKSALNQKYTVVRSAAEKETKTLSQWLAKAKVKPVSIKTVDGKTISSLSKEVLIKISDGIPLKDFIADPVNYQAAIDGFVIYLATMKLGDAVLDKLNSPLGPVNQHEGIVIRDKSISKDPFKITGRFIIRGLASQFKK